MISNIAGTVESLSENTLTVRVGGLSYEVYIPTAVLHSLDGQLKLGAPASLVTYHYYQTDPSKSIPILIGFASRMEKDFFEKFITVSGVGPKAAVKALGRPISEIASAIDAGDLAFLKSLPGIGEQRAKEIIAKLQGKMGRFGLIKNLASAIPRAQGGVREEAMEVMIQLQYKKEEAKDMIEKAFSRSKNMKTVEEVLNEVYRQKKDGKQRTDDEKQRTDDRRQKTEKNTVR